MLAVDDSVLEPMVLAAQRGEASSWHALLDLCGPMLRAAPQSYRPPGWPRCPDIDPDDFRYQLHVILYELVTKYDPTRSASVGAYLAVHFRQRAQNYLRHIARRQMHSVSLDGSVLERVLQVADEEPAGSQYSDEQVRQLREALLTLSPRQRTILVRYYWHDQSLREIAQSMRLSDVCVRQHKSRAERALRARLGVVRLRDRRPEPVGS